MGNFYVNFSVKRPDQQKVADIPRRRRRTALVTLALGEYVVVTDEEADWQDDRVIQTVGELLSRETQAPVFAILNHDDDILAYWLFVDGQLVDSYDSAPDYWDSDDEFEAEAKKEQGGDARTLCKILAATTSPEQIERILRGLSYRYFIEDDELPRGLNEEQLVRVS
jgi:hypothetical protein